MENEIKTPCVIIGSGPAGYTAAIYASRANLNPLVIDGPQMGGQLVTTTEIENFPGYPEGVTGPKLMEDLRAQAERFGTRFLAGRIVEVDFSKGPFTLKNSNHETIIADSVIIATGAAAKYLGLPSEQQFLGMGVSACATCDGFFYRNRVVAVVGGGDTACEEAIYLSKLAKKVYMIVRKDYLRASKVMQKRVFDTENIEVLFNTNTVKLFGDEVLEGAEVVTGKDTPNENTYNLIIDGFFLAIGHKPNTEVFREAVECDEQGYIKVKGSGTATSVEGVFAAGDCADPEFMQAVSAAGMGCRAALQAERYLALKG